MREFNKKKKVKKRLYSKFTIAVLIIILFFLGKSVLNVREKAVISEKKLAQSQITHDALTKKEESTRAQAEFTGSDLGIEDVLRHKYNVAKEGEKVVIIVESPEDENEIQAEEKKGFWSKLLFWKE